MAMFTIGYEGRTLKDYLDLLTANDVCLLIDVRKNPISRKRGFSKTCMKNSVEAAGIEYQHFPQLGIESARRRSLKSSADYEKLFQWYSEEILSNETEALQKIVNAIRDLHRIALTCFEADPSMCHRRLVSEKVSELLSGETMPVHL